MQRIVVALGWGGGELEPFPHRPQQQFQRLDAGGYLVGLQAADRGLAGPDPPSQALLAETAADPGGTDQLTWGHPTIITDM